MSGQGEGHSEKVDICAYSTNNKKNEIMSPTKLVTIIKRRNKFQ